MRARHGHSGVGLAGLVWPGLAMIAVTYGLARFAYGLFLPRLREAFDLSPALLGSIGAGSYVAYCVAVVFSLALTSRTGPRVMAVTAGVFAVVGLATVAVAPAAWVLALGILIAGSSAGLASPPMGEAVAYAIGANEQDRANSLINSGTSIGVALSGPAALLAAEQWRAAWTAFAVVGVAVVVWNALALPGKPSGGITKEVLPATTPGGGGAGAVGPPVDGSAGLGETALTLGYLFGRRSAPLFAAAGGVGFASAAYWTFSRELLVQAGGLGETGSTLFWAVIGVSGLAGGAAGDLVGRFGLRGALRGLLLALAGAVALLAAAPGVLVLGYASAALFGAAYITLSGIILIWSVAVFPERPSAGLGAGFLMIALGQAVGSPVAGALAGATGPRVTFFVFAGLAVLTACIKPHQKDG